MLQLDRIYYKYDRRAILDGISLNIAPRQILCLTGPSGCGKTTLFKIAAGLIKADAGIVRNNFTRTACVFQEPRLLKWRTTRENIAFGLKAKGILKKERDRTSLQLAKQLGLEQFLHYYPDRLSGGMQQRVAIGRSLAIEPDLLLLDEPFSGLDVGRRGSVQEILLKLLKERNLATLIITHDLVEALRLGDRILVMSPNPSKIVYQWQSNLSPADRDEAYIYREVSQLLAIPQVSNCFGLKK